MISLAKSVSNPVFSIYKFGKMREFRFIKFFDRYLFNVGFNPTAQSEIGFCVNFSETCPIYLSVDFFRVIVWFGVLERSY